MLDFGIAKVVGEDVDQHLTQTGVVMGTAEYMSPEQARSDPIDARTDLYAVGVILFEMLTGRVPFKANGFMGTLSKHIMEPPPSPRQVAPLADISRPLERVVLRALAKEPAERYPSAEAFAAALRDLPPFEDGVSRTVRRSWPTAGLAMVLGLAGPPRWAFPGGPAEGFDAADGDDLRGAAGRDRGARTRRLARTSRRARRGRRRARRASRGPPIRRCPRVRRRGSATPGRGGAPEAAPRRSGPGSRRSRRRSARAVNTADYAARSCTCKPR